MQTSGCTLFDSKRCYTCGMLPMSYPEQVKFKYEQLQKYFADTGFKDVKVAPVFAPGNGFRTRSKAKIAVGGSVDFPTLGYVRENLTVAETADCPLYPEPIPEILENLRSLITRHRISPYSIPKDKGELKYVIVQVSSSTGQGHLRLVLRSKEELSIATNILREMQARFPFLISLSVNFQPTKTAIIEGEEEQIISEESSTLEKYGNYSFYLSAQSFSQVNSEAANELYSRAREMIEVSRPANLLDLFCGVGTFSIFCAEYANAVIGVEISSQAIENANRAAELNAVKNCTFLTSDALNFIKSRPEVFSAAIVNPPRRGLGPELSLILKERVENLILYSSCNPKTLFQDMLVLKDDFVPVEAYPVDMFPHSKHLEVLVKLEKK